MGHQIRIAADIGGTFTDIALLCDDGTVATRKVPSTPADYAQGVLAGLRDLATSRGLALADIGEVLHGCTVATNTILEGKGARTGLITTRGFRDVLEFRRIRIPRLYDPLYVKPEPLAPRNLRLEVDERTGPRGEVITPLDEPSVTAAIATLQRENVEAVAVSLLHAYANPAHEQRIGTMLRAALPGAFITLSSDILPEIREYERTSTAVINAYVGPVVARYIGALEAALRAAGIPGRLLVMQSSGGILEAAHVAAWPARIVECGPAAGVIGAARQGVRSGYPDLITLDMGGTTAKASLVEAGTLSRTDEYEVGGGISLSSRLVKGGGYALKLPVIDISEVGAGGGSIVWFDKGGAVKVGPHSAGAVPGPACYGAGGTEATVTDANVVLGYINPTALAGGTMKIDGTLSHSALARVAGALSIPALDAAWAVHVVATASMMRAVKAVSTYRGRNPSDFVLLAFGGNGGVFAVELARQLQMRRVLVPAAAGVFSAVGLLLADLEFGRSRALLSRIDRLDPARLNASLTDLEAEVAPMVGAGAVIRRAAAMRYAGQAFELPVPLPAHTITAADLPTIAARFEAEHERTYGHRLTDASGIDIVAVEVTAARPTAMPPTPPPLTPDPAPEATRHACFAPTTGYVPTPVITRRHLTAAPRPGPLIIEEYEGTTIVPPGASAWLDALHNIVIDTGEHTP